MSNCCSTKKAGKSSCPECEQIQKSVSIETLRHKIISPLNQTIDEQNYFFCSNSVCKTVYFGENGKQYGVENIRGEVGQKQTSSSRIICYCFDVSAQQVLDEIENTGESASRQFVISQTKAKHCACEIRNPSGTCCLASFPNNK